MTFDDFISFIIEEYEGDYSWDPRDPGGETRFGISKRAYPSLDIKNLTIKQAKDIYKLHYWQKIRGEEIPKVLQLVVLDCAINQGVDRAAKLLQSAAGVKVDGIIGPKTLAALNSTEAEYILVRFAELRLKHYQSLENWKVYGKGWSRRLLDVSLVSSFASGWKRSGKSLP